jgi:hypothetical protein
MAHQEALEVEVLIGVLTAVTLILLFLFLVILVYSKRQKFLQSPGASRTLNPFPAVQINMKELLTTSASAASPANLHTAPDLGYSDPHYYQQQQFEDCRSKWHSTGHMDLNQQKSILRSSGTITANPLCSEYASVDIQNINATAHYRTMHQTSGLPPVPVSGSGAPSPATAGAYNLGHYFPRVSSEPPSRKSYQTTGRNGDPLKVLYISAIFSSPPLYIFPFL